MAAGDDSSNEDADDSEDDDDEPSIKTRHISGDDLGDSFSDAAPRTKAVWIDDLLTEEGEGITGDETEDEEEDGDGDGDGDEDEDEDDEEEEEGSEESSGEDDKAQSLKDWEQSDGDNTDLEDDEEEEEEDDDSDDDTGKQVNKANQKKISESKGKQDKGADSRKVKTNVREDVHKKGELPYTIEAPKDFEEFSALLENLSDDQIVEAIRRIRTYNAIAVAAENRKKMQV